MPFTYAQGAVNLVTTKGLTVHKSSINTTPVAVGTVFNTGETAYFKAMSGCTITSIIFKQTVSGTNAGTLSATVSEDALSATAYFTSSSFTYSISTIETVYNPTPIEPTEPTITYTLTNNADVKECYKNGVLVATGEQFYLNDVIKLIVKDGYTFNSVSFSGGKNFTIDSTSKEATFTFTQDVSHSGLNVSAVVIPVVVPVSYKPTQLEIDDFTSRGITLYRGYTSGSTLTKAIANMEFKVGNNIVFKTIGRNLLEPISVTVEGEVKSFEISSDFKQAVFVITSESEHTNLIATSEEVPKYVFTQSDLELFEANKTTLKVGDTVVTVGHKFRLGDIVTASVANGKEFYKNYENLGEEYTSIGFTYYTIDEYSPFKLQNNDYSKAISKPISSNQMTGFYVDTVLVKPDDVRGYNNVYRINEADLRTLTQRRFVVEYKNVTDPNSTQVTVEETTTDYGKFMLGLIELPFDLSEIYNVENQNIMLSTHDTKISAMYIASDAIALDMGSIEVPKVFNDFRDYKNTQVILHLPYSQSVNLDIDYVIGETISIEYVINLYDGVARINIYSSKIDSAIVTNNIDLGITIPYANLETMPSRNDPKNISLGGDNGIKTPFIEILRNDVLNGDSEFNATVIDEDILRNHKGFIKVETIILDSLATSDEKGTIKSLLADGVFIND